MFDITTHLQPFLTTIHQLRKEIIILHQSIFQIDEELFLIENETYEELTNKPNINELVNVGYKIYDILDSHKLFVCLSSVVGM